MPGRVLHTTLERQFRPVRKVKMRQRLHHEPAVREELQILVVLKRGRILALPVVELRRAGSCDFEIGFCEEHRV